MLLKHHGSFKFIYNIILHKIHNYSQHNKVNRSKGSSWFSNISDIINSSSFYILNIKTLNFILIRLKHRKESHLNNLKIMTMNFVSPLIICNPKFNLPINVFSIFVLQEGDPLKRVVWWWIFPSKLFIYL